MVLPATADGAPGVPGGAIGVTAVDGVDEPDVPATLVAVELNVYGVPLVRPITRHDVEGTVTVHEPPAGEDVTR